MADNNQAIEWFLARDGQQHGPVTDAELQKIIEFGYLKPTDLVWRQGMDEWALAESVLDLRPAKEKGTPAPDRPQAPMPNRPEPYRRQGDDPHPSQPAGPVSSGPSAGHPTQRGQPRPHDGQRAAGSFPAPGAPAPARVSGYQPEHLGPSHQGGHPGGHGNGQPNAMTAQEQAAYHQALQGSGGGPAAHKSVAASHGFPAPAPSGRGPQLHGPQPHGQHGGRSPMPNPPSDDDDGASEPGRGFPWRAVAILVVIAGLAGGGFALYRTGALTALPFLGAPTSTDTVPVVSRPSSPSRDAAENASVAMLPVDKKSASMDEFLQKSALWQRLKQDYPDWYTELTTDLSRQASDGRSERELQSTIIRAQVDLRRKHSADALAAGPASLKAIAATFVENLSRLSRESTAACYGYISQGEASPAIAELKNAEQRAGLEGQLSAIFAAVAEGRKSPARYDAPRREDYDALSTQLSKRGWTPGDLQVFTDARALSRAAPEKVCQMVQDWFAAQLSIEDEAAQVRLLGEALKPVVAG